MRHRLIPIYIYEATYVAYVVREQDSQLKVDRPII